MLAIPHRTRKWMVACAGVAIIAAIAVMARGCGNPGEGTVHVDPKVAARLGKFRGVPPAAYGKAKAETIGIKSRLRNGAARK
jgi:hypothetical protein